jgi:hypothetical protein
MYGKHHPAAEPVKNMILVLYGEPGLNQEIFFVTIVQCLSGKSISFFKAVTYLKLFQGILSEASLFEVR